MTRTTGNDFFNGDIFNLGGTSKSYRNSSRQYSRSCWEDHPPLEILNGVVYGGNCERGPFKIPNADIYVGLEKSMAMPRLSENKTLATLPQGICLPIPNFGVPSNFTEFDTVITFLLEALQDGLTVHVGCIGGHGRTGMVLAALAARSGAGGDKPLTWVRENYCKKAVETKSQIEWMSSFYETEILDPVKDF